MEQEKKSLVASKIMNGVKPRNNYSKSILKSKVGTVNKDKMGATLEKIASASKSNIAGHRTKTIENMDPTVMKTGSVVASIVEEEGKDFADYLCDSDGDSDLSDEDESGGTGMSLTAGLADSELMKKSSQELIDSSLLDLLALCKTFKEPTEEFLKEHAV